jgi:hypothetical protein
MAISWRAREQYGIAADRIRKLFQVKAKVVIEHRIGVSKIIPIIDIGVNAVVHLRPKSERTPKFLKEHSSKATRSLNEMTLSGEI